MHQVRLKQHQTRTLAAIPVPGFEWVGLSGTVEGVDMLPGHRRFRLGNTLRTLDGCRLAVGQDFQR